MNSRLCKQRPSKFLAWEGRIFSGTMYYRPFYHVSTWSAFPARLPLRVRKKGWLPTKNSFLLRVFPPFSVGLSRRLKSPAAFAADTPE